MAPPAVNGFISKVPSQGETGARLKWFYLDDSTLAVITPTGITGNSYLKDPTDSARTPSNTSIPAVAGFTPTLDVDGGFYVDVNFANTAPTGQWYIQTTYTHEGVTRTMYLVLSVVTAGASVSGGTPYYCTIEQVRRFFLRNTEELADANSLLSRADLQDVILKKMARIDQFTQRSWRSNVVTDEVGTVTFADKWKLNGDYLVSYRTSQQPVRSITSLKVFQAGQEVDILGSGPDRAGQTWYVHYANGWVYLVGATLPSAARNGIKISYTWGESIVPDDIQEATYRLAAAELLESENFAVELPEDSQTAGTIADKAKRWKDEAFEILDRHKDLIYAVSGG